MDEKKRTERLFSALGQVDENLLASTEKPKKKKRTILTTVLPMAAILALVVWTIKDGIVNDGFFIGSTDTSSSKSEMIEEGNTSDGIESEPGLEGDKEISEESFAGGEFVTFMQAVAPSKDGELFTSDGENEETAIDSLNAASGGDEDVSDGMNTVDGYSTNQEEEKNGAAENGYLTTGSGLHKEGQADSFTGWIVRDDRIKQLLSIEKDGNKVISPLSLSMEMAMVTQLCDKGRCAQLLKLMGYEEDTNKTRQLLKENVEKAWKKNYYDRDAEKETCVFSNALWLRNDTSYQTKKILTVAKYFNTTTNAGEMGSTAYDGWLSEWVNENGRNLLEKETASEKLGEDCQMAVSSTIYYQAEWKKKMQGVSGESFYGTKGKVTVDMLHDVGKYPVYEGEHFTAVRLPLKDGRYFYIFLPKEGNDLQAVYDDSIYEAILNGTADGKKKRLSLYFPELDITTRQDMAKDLKQIGVTDIFSEKKTFQEFLCGKGTTLSKVFHSVRLRVGNAGVALWDYEDMAEKEITKTTGDTEEFRVNRPFGFAIADDEGTVYFEGIMQR